MCRGAHCVPLRKKWNLKFNDCQKERPHDKTSLKKCVEEHSVLHKKQMAVQKLIAKLPRVRIGVWQDKIGDLLANWIDNDKSS